MKIFVEEKLLKTWEQCDLQNKVNEIINFVIQNLMSYKYYVPLKQWNRALVSHGNTGASQPKMIPRSAGF